MTALLVLLLNYINYNCGSPNAALSLLRARVNSYTQTQIHLKMLNICLFIYLYVMRCGYMIVACAFAFAGIICHNIYYMNRVCVVSTPLYIGHTPQP